MDRIIAKFLNKEANIHELDLLDEWLTNKDNRSVFNHFVKTDFLITVGMLEYDVDKAKKAIGLRLKKEVRRKRFVKYRRIAIAASIVLVFGITLFTQYERNQPIEVVDKTPVSVNGGFGKAILTLDNGDEVALEKGKDFRAGMAKGNGEELVYIVDDKVKDTEEPKFNFLTIPRGGQFSLLLSDGTQVWLNSESKLKYPVKFENNKTRKVELVYGEAYFKVSPSTNHNGSTFLVRTKFQEVNVLGTEFNVRAYKETDEVSTTLIEGTVQIRKGVISQILKPNQQSKIRSDEEGIYIEDIDVSQEISWVQGLFAFNEESLEDIMIELSRWYDVEVVFESSAQRSFVFTGIVERDQTIGAILDLIEGTSADQVKFEVKDNTIIIK
ncbi:hypothetical protein KCTC52924_01106 [Arenibacter antarcticus]|uniref:FecR family protein n=1 Tax=Arenibacter antarcticus TaxID=2040469 RepID=A0ABW5VCS3_9FLAO|nr:FecR domain-containing protein [Arenibacter sp. H213]MCM4167400.1 anti-sigma factor [Arenibacter sp. H213]